MATTEELARASGHQRASPDSSFEDFLRRVPGVGQVVDIFDPAHPGEAEAQQLAALYENLKYTDPSSDPRYAAALKQLQDYATGGLTAADRAREYEALGEAQNFAQGETGAIAQDAAARGGGGAGVNSIRQQVAAQGAAKRLGSADVATAGMAAQRALAAQQEFSRQMQMNTEMQNNFAMQKAGGQGGAIKNLEALKLAESESQRMNRDALTNSIAGMALGVPIPPTAKATAPSVSQDGYTSSGNIAIPTPGGTSSVLSPSAPSALTDFNPIPGSAAAAAQAYTASMQPFAGMATPGSAPSTTSDDPQKRPNRGY